MAKTDAERQKDWRDRQREKRGIVAVMPVSDHEAFKAKVRAAVEADRAQIAALLEQVTLLEDQAAGKRVPPCRVCGHELGCPNCYRTGDDY
jgi:hypothetical protein